MDCVRFFFQAEGGIRDLVRSRGLGDVYKRQVQQQLYRFAAAIAVVDGPLVDVHPDELVGALVGDCLLYTSDAADDLLCVDLGGRRCIKKKNNKTHKNKNIFTYSSPHLTLTHLSP